MNPNHTLNARPLILMALLAGAMLALAFVAPGQARALSLEKPELTETVMTDDGPSFSWEAIDGATSYRVYRRQKVDGTWSKWERIATNKGQAEISFTDESALLAHVTYGYRVRAHAGSTKSSYSSASTVTTPKMVDPEPQIERASGSATAKVIWTSSQYCDGYTIEYSASKLFGNAGSVEVDGRASDEATVKLPSADGTYYLRVRAHQAVGDANTYSYWGYSANATTQTSATVTRVKAKKTLTKNVRVKVNLTTKQYKNAKAKAKKAMNKAKKKYAAAKKKYTKANARYQSNKQSAGLKKARSSAKKDRSRAKSAYAKAKKAYKSVKKYTYKTKKQKYQVSTPFEIASAAGQVLGGYDTVQGSCTDGTYAYFILNNRVKANCKIAKVRLSNMNIVKVSGVLGIGHGNDVAYDPNKKCLVIAQGATWGLVLPRVDCKTLTLLDKVKVTVPTTLQGATSTQLTKLSNGASGIVYDKKSGEFIVSVRGSDDFLRLDPSLVPVGYVKVNAKTKGIRQNNEMLGNHMIAVSEAPSGSSLANQLHIYDTEGASVRFVKLGVGHELESVFAVGDDLYASVYVSGFNSRENYLYKIGTGVSEL